MAINKQCAQYCIDVIRRVMQEEEIPPMPNGLTLEELYAFAKLHSVETLVYHGLSTLDMDEADPTWQDWENRSAMLLTQSIVQLAERDALYELLPAAGVKLLPVKGCWLKEQYPDIDYRQMSDLDMLIPNGQAPVARELMLARGYERDEHCALHHDDYQKPPYLGVELHHCLLPEDDENYGYYENIWEKAEAVEGYPDVYRLKAEDEYIYYLLHLRKHVLFSGIGIRAFLDSVVYRRTYPNMDKAYLQGEYEKLSLTEFVKQVETLGDCWFQRGTPVPTHLEAMAHRIIEAGAYGTDAQQEKIAVWNYWKKFRSPSVGKLVYLLQCLFLPFDSMKELYPILKKAPVLLPLLWVWRPISKLATDPKSLKNRVKRANEESEEAWSEYSWLDTQSK